MKLGQGWFRSIRAKLALALVFGVLVVIVLGVVSYLAMQKMYGAHQRLHEHPYAVGTALRDIQRDILLMESQLQILADAPSRLRLRRFEREVALLETNVRNQLYFVQSRFLGDPEMAETAINVFEQWPPVRHQVVEAIQEGDSVTAYTIAKTDGARQMGMLNAQLENLLNDSMQRSVAIKSEYHHLWSSIVGTQAIAFILALSAMAITLRFIDRSIVQPTTDISEAAQRVSDGDLTTEIPHTDYRNEIGDIARATKSFLETAISISEAKFDFLTGLPNRDQLSDHLKKLSEDADGSRVEAALLHFDLDRFSEINDSYGRSVGDKLLLHVADVLKEEAGEDDLVARDGADSFVILKMGKADLGDLTQVAQNLCAQVADFEKSEAGEVKDITVTCSVGIARCDNATRIEDLLNHGESALGEGRSAGRGAISIYTEELDARLQRRRAMLQGLKFALAHDEIVPFFQPQIDAVSSELTGVEALVRWNHPEEGVLLPWQFFDVAQVAGLLGEITETMISKSIDQLARWRKSGLMVPRVSINFAANDLRRADFVDRLLLKVDGAGLVPADICVELLESAMIEDADDPVTKTLGRLSDLGFPIELDDFGTGHAAISTLHLVKLNGIKIDRSFVTRLHERPEQQHLTRGILRISRALNISTLAEGVESDEERQLLIDLGCEMIQGFSIAHPMSGDETTHWIKSYQPQAFAEPMLATG